MAGNLLLALDGEQHATAGADAPSEALAALEKTTS
jgi:hypothetical protein